MEFTKAHGTGNDFVVLIDMEDRLDLADVLVQRLCDRHLGVGGDGLIRIGAPREPTAHVFMDYRNADGGTVEMCGNGVRVVAKLAVDRGLFAPDSDVVRIDTRAGVKPVRIVSRHANGTVDRVTVDMGAPRFDPVEVPFEADDADALLHEVHVNGQRVSLAVASMGNPHGVLIVDDVAAAPVSVLGPALEGHPRFPQKANIGFVQLVDRDRVRLRVWERGVGETQACGTGACAAVAVLQRQGQLGETVAVDLPGGTLTVHHTTGGTVHMTGPAVEVARGTLADDWLRQAATTAL